MDAQKAAVVCPSCGQPVFADAFCSGCGGRLSAPAPPATPTTEPTAPVRPVEPDGKSALAGACLGLVCGWIGLGFYIGWKRVWGLVGLGLVVTAILWFTAPHAEGLYQGVGIVWALFRSLYGASMVEELNRDERDAYESALTAWSSRQLGEG